MVPSQAIEGAVRWQAAAPRVRIAGPLPGQGSVPPTYPTGMSNR